MSAAPTTPPIAASPTPSPAPSQPQSQSSTQALLASDNVWHALLSRSQRLKSRHSPSTLIVFGNRGSGKSTILQHFRDRHTAHHHHHHAKPVTASVSQSQPLSLSNVSTEYLLSYSYVNVKDSASADVDDILTVMHIWCLDSDAHIDVLLSLLSDGLTQDGAYQLYQSLMVMIVIDASDVANVERTCQKWLAVCQKVQQKLFALLTQSQRQSLLVRQSLHVQSYYNHDLASTPEEVKASVPEVNYGLPLLVTVTHTDALTKSSFPSTLSVDDRLECLSYVTRRLALTHGASLIFTASNTNSSTNYALVQSYCYYRLYDMPVIGSATPKAIAVSDDTELYVPAGYDSNDLIESSQTKPNHFNEGTRASDMLTVSEKKSGSAKTKVNGQTPAVMISHDNNAFLKQLQFALSQESSATAAVTGTITNVESASVSKPIKERANSGDSGTTSGSGSAQSSPRRGHVSTHSIGGSSLPKGKDTVAVKAFFKSLLQQPAPTTAANAPPDANASKRASLNVRKDVEKELKRMSEAQSQSQQPPAQ